MKEALTRKIGPLPTWAWVAIAATLVIGWAVLRGRQSQQSQQSARVEGVVPPVVLTTPPVQDEDTDDDEGPERHHRHRKRPRSHPLHEPGGGDHTGDHDHRGGHQHPLPRTGGGGTGPPTVRRKRHRRDRSRRMADA